MKSDDLLIEAKEAFELCVEREQDNRVEARDDLEFARLGRQWPDTVLKLRQEQQRPCMVFNRLPAFIRQVVNDARQNQPAIKVHPVDDGADQETAKIYDGLIRNIEVTSKADQAYDTALDSAVTMGFGYFGINTKYANDDTFDTDIVVERKPNPFAIYGDPHSTAADSADWNVAFETEFLTRKEFKRRFKGADEVDWQSGGYDNLEEVWMEDSRIRVAKYWTRTPDKKPIVGLSDGQIIDARDYTANKAFFDAMGLQVVNEREVPSHKVTWSMMTGAEVLETNDWAGKYIPLIPVYGDDVNFEGKRFLRSLTRDAKDPQRNFNYWRTTATELVALAPKAPWIGKKGAFEHDIAKWDTAHIENHPFMEYTGDTPPERQPFPGVPAGAIQEALNAADDMKAIMGIHDASLGAPSNETSGRAIMLRQREGDTSSFHFIDNLSRAIEHGGRIILDLIPHVYTPGRIIRVLDGEGGSRTVSLGEHGQQTPPDQQPPQQAPQGQGTSPQAVEWVYCLTAGKYDLTVETGPSFNTKREEAAQGMIALIQADPASAAILAPQLVKNLDWPGADKIVEQYQQSQQNQVSPAQQAQQESQAKLQMAQQEAQARAQADAQAAQAQATIKQQQAQTDAQLAVAKMQHEFQLRQQMQAQELQLARERMQAEIEMQREKAMAEATIKAAVARHAMENAPKPAMADAD